MMVPPNAPPDVQEAFRQIHARLDRISSANPAAARDLHGARQVHGSALQPDDLATLDDVRRIAGGGGRQPLQAGGLPVSSTQGGGSSSGVDTLDTLTVRQLLRVMGLLLIPRLTDGSKHHGVLFVASDGNVSVHTDGAFALDYNDVDGALELGYGMLVKWLNQAAMGSPAVDVVNVVDHAGGTSLLRFVLGLDDATGIAMRKNGTTLEIRVGGGGALTDLKAKTLTQADGILLHSTVNLTDGAAAQAGTLTNAPAAGNPTKWIEIDDNGTTRKVPSW